ncbi:methyltransferase domain-containing protein [Ancylobacter sp. G4_0304]|uniref:class I SAM-dependent DNA methyltransferase n=1 Tax=Ancylobacter sp. G4_0304 TaxID=3114289 RepID=UPI0039C6A219
MAAVPLFLSSGDPSVDRRIEWARALLEEGNPADAAELLVEALRRENGYAPGWFLLGEARETAGDAVGAADAFARALEHDPQDRLGAGLRLARLTGGATPDMSPAYVRTLFDQYADRFDDALARLGYRGPELIDRALEAACRALGQPYAFARAHDLGCGTGLVGARLAERVGSMCGVDLSPNMVERARRRGCYDELVAGDMVEFLRARPGEDADLIFAGDAFCYLGDLDPILAEAHRVLEPAGLLAFTVETHDGDGILLRETMRYAHTADYVRAELAGAGLALASLDADSTRNESGQPVPGLVAVARRVE